MSTDATAPAAYTRAQQETDELCAGAIRALSGQAAIRYRGRRLHDGHRPLPIHAAHLQPDAALQDLPSLRGAADSVACVCCTRTRPCTSRCARPNPWRGSCSSCWNS